MNNEQILKKAIDKAVKDGWDMWNDPLDDERIKYLEKYL